MEDEPTITITMMEYNALVKDSRMLEALEVTGVDNWEGYDEAMELFHQS